MGTLATNYSKDEDQRYLEDYLRTRSLTQSYPDLSGRSLNVVFPEDSSATSVSLTTKTPEGGESLGEPTNPSGIPEECLEKEEDWEVAEDQEVEKDREVEDEDEEDMITLKPKRQQHIQAPGWEKISDFDGRKHWEMPKWTPEPSLIENAGKGINDPSPSNPLILQISRAVTHQSHQEKAQDPKVTLNLKKEKDTAPSRRRCESPIINRANNFQRTETIVIMKPREQGRPYTIRSSKWVWPTTLHVKI